MRPAATSAAGGPSQDKKQSVHHWLVSQEKDTPSTSASTHFPSSSPTQDNNVSLVRTLAPDHQNDYAMQDTTSRLLPSSESARGSWQRTDSSAESPLGVDDAMPSGPKPDDPYQHLDRQPNPSSLTSPSKNPKQQQAAAMRRLLVSEQRRRRAIIAVVIVAVLCLTGTVLAIYFTVIRKNSSGSPADDDGEAPEANPFPHLPALSSPGTFPITSLPRPSSPSASRIVFDPQDRSNLGEYRLAKGDGGNSGAVAIHIGLMKGSSKVAMLQRWDYLGTNATRPGTNFPAWSTEYDYTTDSFRPLTLRSNVFCGGGMLLPDGKMMVLGGAENYTEMGGLLDGMKAIRLLSPSGSAGKFGSQDWVDDPSNSKISLASKRWYPSVVMLPEGRMLIIGGTIVAVAFTSPPNNTGTMEIIPPPREFSNPNDALIPLQFLWDTLPANLYPTTALLPSGRIFVTASDRAIILDPSLGYNALKTFFLRPTVISASARPSGSSPGVGGFCLQPPTSGLNLTATAVTPGSNIVGILGTRLCASASDFNQNRTADHPQSFAFFGSPKVSPTNFDATVGAPILRDTYPGAGWVVHTLSRMCLTVADSARVGAVLGFRRCVAEDSDQIFDVGSGEIRHAASGSCVNVVGDAAGTSTVTLDACNNALQSPSRIEMVDTSVYFEFPRLPGGPFRSYPWTGTGLILPLDPQNNYEPGVMVCGGAVHPQGLQAVESNASIALSTCGLIYPERPDANWTMEVMPSPRVLGDLIHLPDGTLLLLNGAQRGMAGWDLGRNPNLAAHLYNPLAPVGSRWSVLNSSTIPRMYHSSAMLLPDGRVMVAGSSPNSPTDPSWSRLYENEYRIEYFHPPYLLNRNASRPRPIIAEMAWQYGKPWIYNTTYSVRIGTADSSASTTKGIRLMSPAEGRQRTIRFNLVQTGFRTHSTSFGQRLVWLVSGSVGENGEVVVGAPPSAAIAPPGWYLLFVVMDGVVGEGKWVQVGGDPAGLGAYYSGL
ncbi:hypothetical protein HDU67_010129 [Dinochytrium kinnereticum]|nr:hypothetical protein HDU67_010129 [Dinochytrium kinnereticum]